MPEAYDRTGLRQIIRLRRHRDDYLEMLTALASQIVAVAESGRPVPYYPNGRRFEEVSSAFHKGGPTPASSAAPAGRVEFVIAAPSRADLAAHLLPGVARDPRFYGDEPRHWAPYRPELDSPIADRAREIALEHQFQAVVTDLDGLRERFDTAAPGERIVVLLIDLWVTGLPRHRGTLARFDEIAPEATPAIAVLIPTSHDDEQTHDYLTQLMATLGEVFTRRMTSRPDVTFRTAILSPQSFDADLGVVLERSRNRMFRTSTVHRRPPGRSGERPILRGP
jgi:FxsC-like protein